MAEQRFPDNSLVKIDGRGLATVLRRKASTSGDIYTVMLDGIDFKVDLPSHRLSIVTPPTPASEQTTGSGRFLPVTDADVDGIVLAQRNKATTLKTNYNMKILREFMRGQQEERELHNIPPHELNNLLSKFFVSVRKPDGSEYEPVTLRGFLGSFDRYLRENDYPCSIINGFEFSKLKGVLKAKQKQLKSAGLGSQPNKAEPVSDQEVEHLWCTGQLGCKTPESIINTLWFYTTVVLGLRGSDEHRDMCWGDLKLGNDETGHEFLQFVERQAKTRQGDNPRNVRAVKPKMWANLEDPERCPIAVYKVYASHRPADFCKPSDPFYIATHTMQNNIKPGEQWFKRQPVGQNKLTSIMKRMAAAAELPGEKRLTNHSARKRCVQVLAENNVPPNQIMQITGHRNIQSINNYSHISQTQHKQISGILTSSANGPRNPMLALQQNNTLANTSLNTSMNTVHNSNTAGAQATCTFHGGLNNIFAGNISGGTFNINITSSSANKSPQSPDVTKKRSRRRIILDSDSD